MSGSVVEHKGVHAIQLKVPEFSDTQKQVLIAMADAFIAPMSSVDADAAVAKFATSPEHAKEIRAYCMRKATDNDTIEKVIQVISNPFRVPASNSSQLLMGLDLMGRPFASWILTGSTTPFHLLPPNERQTVLVNMIHSSIPLRRALVNGIRSVLMSVHYGNVPLAKRPGVDRTRVNVNWAAIGYPGPDPRITDDFVPPNHPYTPLSMQNMIEISSKTPFDSRISTPRLLSSLSQTIPPSLVALAYNSFFDKIAFPAPSLAPPVPSELHLEADVVIIGSGAGAGVVASRVAKQGRRVIVLEKGPYVSQADLSLLEQDAFTDMYEGAGMLTTEDGAMAVLAGSTFGGGTAVNWSCTLPLPHYVREEWADDHGLPVFKSAHFSKLIAEIQARMGVTEGDKIAHNGANALLIEGCRKLGYPYGILPQNASSEHTCGWCGLGCKHGQKQGSHNCFFVDASKNGAAYIPNCYVKKVITSSPTSTSQGKRVTRGVAAVLTNPATGQAVPLIIKSSVVVVSAGALNSPLVLRRSGLENPHIGKNLRLHPVSGVVGCMGEKKVDHFAGAIMTAICDVAANPEGDYYGCKLEVPSVHPSIAAFASKWESSTSFKTSMLTYRNLCCIIALGRDKGSGSVVENEIGLPKISYTLCAKDGRSLTKGVVAGYKILAAAGATRLMSSQMFENSTVDIDPQEGLEDPVFKAFVNKVEEFGVHHGSCSLFSAHQMGSCRMSASPAAGAVDPSGETWEVSNLFVADASLFPTSSGVNPMLTTMSIARHVADYVAVAVTRAENEAKSAGANGKTAVARAPSQVKASL